MYNNSKDSRNFVVFISYYDKRFRAFFVKTFFYCLYFKFLYLSLKKRNNFANTKLIDILDVFFFYKKRQLILKPTVFKKNLITVIRSPFVNKVSKEQFERRKYSFSLVLNYKEFLYLTSYLRLYNVNFYNVTAKTYLIQNGNLIF